MKIAQLGLSVFVCASFSAPALADEIADFYAGKRMTHVIGHGTGGSYDSYSRLLDRHIGRHIPGNPTVISQNMPGAGGRKAAGWLYNVAPKDGTVIATFSQNIPIDQALSKKSLKYDVRKFNWIGNAFQSNNILMTWHRSGVKTIEDARKKEVTVGGTGMNSPDTFYPRVANSVLGTKFRIIPGYKSGSAIDLAMERGEVGGRGSTSWLSTKIQRPDWIRDKKFSILFQMGTRKEPELPQIPLLSDLGKTKEQRQILEFVSSNVMLGRPVVTAPGVPASRVVALRKAFDDTMKDPVFLADAEKHKMVVSPVSGTAIQAHVVKTVEMPPQVLEKIRRLSGPKRKR
jgi:tripartite-type tricarboxylate transporter receptor subunit TctC